MNTTRNETRSDTLREQNLREEEWTYEEPDALTIPEVVQARFDNEAMPPRRSSPIIIVLRQLSINSCFL